MDSSCSLEAHLTSLSAGICQLGSVCDKSRRQSELTAYPRHPSFDVLIRALLLYTTKRHISGQIMAVQSSCPGRRRNGSRGNEGEVMFG